MTYQQQSTSQHFKGQTNNDQQLHQHGQATYQQAIAVDQSLIAGNNVVGLNQQFIPQQQIISNGVAKPVFFVLDPNQALQQQLNMMEANYVSQIKWFSCCNICVGISAIILFIFAIMARIYWKAESIHPTEMQRNTEGDMVAIVGTQQEYMSLLLGFDLNISGYFFWFFASFFSLGLFKQEYRQRVLFAYQFFLILSIILLSISFKFLLCRLLGWDILFILAEIIYTFLALLIVVVRSLFLICYINQIKVKQQQLSSVQQNQGQQMKGNYIL